MLLQVLRSATLLKRHSKIGVFSKHCEVFKKTYFVELLRTVASNQNKQLDILLGYSANYYRLWRIFAVKSQVTDFAQSSSQLLMLKTSVINLQPKFIIWGSTLPSKIKNEEN